MFELRNQFCRGKFANNFRNLQKQLEFEAANFQSCPAKRSQRSSSPLGRWRRRRKVLWRRQIRRRSCHQV